LSLFTFVIARLVRATHFFREQKMDRPHEAGDDEFKKMSPPNPKLL
jgi:hypothetical protein